MKYFLAVFLFCSVSFAWKMEFHRTSHLGYSRRDIAKEENGHYFFTGRNLGKTLPSPVLKAWKEMAKGPSAESAANVCPAGTYTFTKTDKKTETLRGCMQGKAYGNYIAELEVVRRYAKGSAK